jgi:hypothetical protein
MLGVISHIKLPLQGRAPVPWQLELEFSFLYSMTSPGVKSRFKSEDFATAIALKEESGHGTGALATETHGKARDDPSPMKYRRPL